MLLYLVKFPLLSRFQTLGLVISGPCSLLTCVWMFTCYECRVFGWYQMWLRTNFDYGISPITEQPYDNYLIRRCGMQLGVRTAQLNQVANKS